MTIPYPYVARQATNKHGKSYCCPCREQRLKIPLTRNDYYTPRIGGYQCKKCKYHIKTMYMSGLEYVCCKWMSKSERRVYEKTFEG